MDGIELLVFAIFELYHTIVTLIMLISSVVRNMDVLDFSENQVANF